MPNFGDKPRPAVPIRLLNPLTARQQPPQMSDDAVEIALDAMAARSQRS